MLFSRRVLCSLLLVCLLSGAASPALGGQPPLERIKAGMEKLVAMLSDPVVLDPKNYDESIVRLRKVAEQYIDFDMVTKYSVGRPWLDMSPKMQADLTEAFIRLLERSYLRRIPAYNGQEIVFQKEDIQGQKAKVLAEIIDKDKKIVIEFRLRLSQNRWMAYDVVAEGVSLVMNYRSQFSEVLSKGTPEDLLRVIRERIETIDREHRAEEQGS